MEALTIILLVSTLVSVLFILFMKYKVNKIKKKEEELFKKINTISHVELESKNTRNFSSKRADKNTSKDTKNYHYIVGIDPVDDDFSRVIITSSSDIYEPDWFGNGGSFGGNDTSYHDGFGSGGSFGGGGASGSWDSSSDSGSDSDSDSGSD